MVVSRPWSARSRSVRLAGLGCPTVVQRARVREHGSGLRAQRDRGAQGMSKISAKFENKVARLLRLADVRGREEVDLVCQVVEQVGSPACLIRSLASSLTCAHTSDFAAWWAGASDAFARARACKRARVAAAAAEEGQVAALEGCTRKRLTRRGYTTVLFLGRECKQFQGTRSGGRYGNVGNIACT